MNEKDPIAIFPLTRALAPVIRFYPGILHRPIRPVLPVSLKHLHGEDLSRLDGGDVAGVCMTADYREALACCKTVIIHPSDDVKPELVREVTDFADNNHNNVIVLPADNHQWDDWANYRSDSEFIMEEIKEVPFPVLSVFSLGYHCGQLSIELLLRQYFQEKGYKVAQISSESAMQLFDAQLLPSFVRDSALSPERRALLFNRYLLEIGKDDMPDLMIIGVSDPVMKYSNRILNGMGMLPFIIQNAVQTDVGLVSLHSAAYTQAFFSELSNLFKYRYNCPVHYFHVSNMKAMADDQYKKLNYVMVNHTLTEREIQTETYHDENHVFHIFDWEKAWKMCESVEAELLENVEVL